MRFSALKIGDHFFFEGREYTKTSPVLACDADGKSKFIPRSATLQFHPTQSPQTKDEEHSDLDRLYLSITRIIQQEVHDRGLEVKLRHAIEKAWKKIKNAAD